MGTKSIRRTSDLSPSQLRALKSGSAPAKPAPSEAAPSTTPSSSGTSSSSGSTPASGAPRRASPGASVAPRAELAFAGTYTAWMLQGAVDEERTRAPELDPEQAWTFDPELVQAAGYPFALPERAAEIDGLLEAGDADRPSDTPNPQPSGGAGATDLFDAVDIARGDSPLGELDDDERAYLFDQAAADWATSDRPDRQADLDALAASLADEPELSAELLDAFARTSVLATQDGRHRDAANLSAGFVAMTSDAEELRGALEAIGMDDAVSIGTSLAYEDAANPDDRGVVQRRIVEAVATGEPSDVSAAVLNTAFITMAPDAVRGSEADFAAALASHWYPEDAAAAADVAPRVEEVLATEQGRDFLFNPNVSPVERLDNLRRLHDHDDWDAELFTATESVYDNPRLLFDAARPVLDDYAARTDGPVVLEGTDLDNTIGSAMNEAVSVSPLASEEELAEREAAIADGEGLLYEALPPLSFQQRATMSSSAIEAYEAQREASQASEDRVTEVADAIRALEDDPENGIDTAAITVLPIQYSHESIGTVTYPLFRVEDANDPSQLRFVDHQGRTYDDFDDWRHTNALEPGSMVWPEGGALDGRLVRANTPRTVDTPAERAQQVVNTAALVGGTIAGGVLLVGGTGGVGGGVALGVVAASGAWQAGQGAQVLIDRAEHGQNWTDLSDPSVRSAWLNVGAGAASTLAIGAVGVNRALQTPLAASLPGTSHLHVPVAAAQRYLGITATLADTAAASDAAYTLGANFDELSGGQRLALLGQIGFWGAGTLGVGRATRPFDFDTHVTAADAPSHRFPLADGDPTAQHLPPNIPGYNEVQVGPSQQAFLDGMSAAIQRSVRTFGEHVGPVDGGDVRAAFDDITQTRFDLAEASNTPDAELFITDAGAGLPPVDFINPGNRHRYYFDRANALPEDSPLWSRPFRGQAENTITVDGREVPLSVVTRDADGNIEIHHPPFAWVEGDPDFDVNVAVTDPAHVQEHAFDLYAEVLNDPTLTLDEGLERIAEASFLLYHYTPNVRGTPAVVSSLNDAVLRERFGVTFPPLRTNTEPFWEAIFAGADGMDAFVRDFPSFYEPFGG